MESLRLAICNRYRSKPEPTRKPRSKGRGFLYWSSQDGLCAISKLPMVHRFNSLYTISVDRIDSGRGYVPGNVQLVCQCINRMKNNNSNEDVAEFLKKVDL
jgi:hypothetical protein